MKKQKKSAVPVASVSARALQEVLVGTINELRAGKTDPAKANSIAALSRETCRIARLQIEYYRLTNTAPGKRSVGLLKAEG